MATRQTDATAELTTDGGLQTLSRDECLELLGTARVGRVAVIGPGSRLVIRPVNYLFDASSQSVTFRTTRGTKLHALLRTARATFEVDAFDPDGRSGWSVILEGVTEEVTRPAEIQRLNASGLDTWAPGYGWHWLRIHTGRISGRRLIDGSPAASLGGRR